MMRPRVASCSIAWEPSAYRHLEPPIHLIAVEFSKDARNVAAFEVERAA